MSKENVLATLTDLGLKKIESKVYFYLAKKGPKKAKEITRAIGVTKQRLYPILKELERKSIVNPTLGRPAKFEAISYEKLLDLFAKTKLEEAKILQRNKGKLLSDWKSINPETIGTSVFFTRIQGKKYVYSKMQQMIQETKQHFSVISTVSDLFHAEQQGVLDSLQNHPNKEGVTFRIITDISLNYLEAIKELLATISPQIKLKSRNSNLGLTRFPRMVLRDDEEILYFISNDTTESSDWDNQDAFFSNCSSLVAPLSNLFKNLWRNSTDIEQKITELEQGINPPRTEILEDAYAVRTRYENALKNAKNEIFLVSSSEGLTNLEKNIPGINDQSKTVSVKILSPIKKENYQEFKELSKCCEIKHIPQGFLDIAIIDGEQLFQFPTSSISHEFSSTQNLNHTLYSNDPEHIQKTKRMLEYVWRNSSRFSLSPVPSFVDTLDSVSTQKPVSNNKSKVITEWLRSKPIVELSAPAEISEDQVLNKILNNKRIKSSSKVDCYCKLAYAAVNPPENSNLPRMLFEVAQIDKKSTFGAEDRITFYILKKTSEGFKYVPFAIIGDNPNFPVELVSKGQHQNTPASKNYCLFERDEIQFQHYGNVFLASWLRPVPLIPDKLILSPGTLIFKTYGKLRSHRVVVRYPLGVKYDVYYNAFDSFITFMYDSSTCVGSGIDGLFLRDTYIELTFPK